MGAKRNRTPSEEHLAPEGPYEGPAGRPADLKYSVEMLHTIELVSELRSESRRTLRLGVDLREMGIVLHLVRNHFLGRLTTHSTLAHESGMSYSTAYRSIDAMIVRGLILRRERTSTGKSFSLHPSPELLEHWQEFAYRTRRLISASADAMAISVQSSKRPSSRRNTDKLGVVPPPSVLKKKLQLSRGLRVLFHADPTSMAMSGLREQFEMILGVGIRHRAMSIDRLRHEIVENSKKQLSSYDLIACDLPWFGDMISRGRLLSLDSLIAESELDLGDFLPDSIASVRRDGQIYGLPLLTTAELLVFRQDVFREAGVHPPQTISGLLEAASRLHKPNRGIRGIAWNGARGTALGHTFMFIMAAHGHPILGLAQDQHGFCAEDAAGEHLRPAFDRPEARATAELLLELLPYSPPNVLSMTWIDRARAYAEGDVAMAYCHTTLANLFELDESSPACRRTGYMAHPTAPGARPISPLGGYALTIPSNIAPERIPAAWTAMQAFTSASAAKLFVANGNLASPRFSLARDPEIAAMSPLIGAVDRLARSGTLRMWPRPPVPGISSVMIIAGEEIHDMLKGEKSVSTALAKAQNRADQAMRERGHY